MDCNQKECAKIYISQCQIPAEADADDFVRGLALLPLFLHSEIHRYHRLEDRLTRLTARLLLRKSLQTLTFFQESSLENWCKSPEGRPFLQDSRIDFSISHAYPWVVSAVGINCRIGVDVEMYRPLDINTFIPYLTTTEQEYVCQATYPERELLHCWSLREAILKADGRGLLARESCIRNIHSLQTQTGKPWQVEQLDFNHNGCLYIACDCRHPVLHREQEKFTELIPA